MRFIILLSGLWLVCWSPVVAAQAVGAAEGVLYRWMDDGGQVHYGTEVPAGVDAQPIQIEKATSSAKSTASSAKTAGNSSPDLDVTGSNKKGRRAATTKSSGKSTTKATSAKATSAKASSAKASSANSDPKAAKRKRKPSVPSSTALERQRLSRRSKCIEAKAKLRRIDNRFRAGFKGAEGERLRERQQTWTMVKNEFCSPN